MYKKSSSQAIATPVFSSIKSTEKASKRLKKSSLLMTVLPIAACNGNNPVPDFIETQANHFTAQTDTGGTFLQGSNTANLTVTGGAGNDFITTGSGNDILNGEDGNDILNGGDGNDILNGGEGDDELNGGSGNDILNAGGNSSYDILYGGDGNDTLYGNNTSNILVGGLGADIFYGGTVDYSDSPEGININLLTNTASGGHAAGDIINSTSIRGSNFNDTITIHDQGTSLLGVRGNDGDDLLNGGAGEDYLFGGAGNDTLNGFGQNDYLYGNEGNDILNGGAGYDNLSGGTGADILNGGDGKDTVRYDGDYPSAITVNLTTNTASDGDTLISVENVIGSYLNDTIIGNDQDNSLSGFDGNDIINGGNGSDRIYGGSGNDTLNGDDGDDELSGDFGDDILNGGNGTDGLFGGVGVDILNGGAGDDIIQGGEGADILDGGAGIDLLSYSDSDEAVNINLSTHTAFGGHAEGDIFSNFENVSGSQFDDTIIGDDQDTYLSGGLTGNDTLIGAGGNDTLNGGGGKDILDGGSGDDLLTTYGYYTGIDLSTYDGGTDIDTLTFIVLAPEQDLNIDLSNLSISNMEILDLENKTFQSYDRAELITLTINDVLDVTDVNNELRIDGNANDSVTSIGQGWTSGADQIIDGETYNLYTAGGAALLIDEDISQTIS